jgi:hypothetical protein
MIEQVCQRGGIVRKIIQPLGLLNSIINMELISLPTQPLILLIILPNKLNFRMVKKFHMKNF